MLRKQAISTTIDACRWPRLETARFEIAPLPQATLLSFVQLVHPQNTLAWLQRLQRRGVAARMNVFLSLTKVQAVGVRTLVHPTPFSSSCELKDPLRGQRFHEKSYLRWAFKVFGFLLYT